MKVCTSIVSSCLKVFLSSLVTEVGCKVSGLKVSIGLKVSTGAGVGCNISIGLAIASLCNTRFETR